MYMDLQNSFGSPESVDKSGIIDNNNYYTSTPDTFYTAGSAGIGVLVIAGSAGASAGVAALPLPNQNNQGSLVASTIPRSAWSDCWSYGYCFDRLKHAKFHGVELDGKSYAAAAA